jgi:hypothetical protein
MKKFSDIKQAQEALREAQWNPAKRWKIIQETITWAEAQTTVQRNTRRACLIKQARLLKALAGA